MSGAFQFSIVRRLLPAQPVPDQYRRIFTHLFFDIAWFGIVSGTTFSYLSVYVARLGGSPSQVGLLSALPALINLIFAIPVGNWVRRRNLGSITFWSAVLSRIFYLPLVVLPWLANPAGEIWVILALTLVMNIPITVINVSFNAMMIEVVPTEWRAFVVGGRNGLLSIVSFLSTMLSGQILTRLDFPVGYQVVFGLGFLGAALSCMHLFFLRNVTTAHPATSAGTPAQKKFFSFAEMRLDLSLRKYLRVLLLLFCFHIAQWLVIPIVPLYSVNFLRLNDFEISIGNGVFNMVVFVGSFFLGSVIAKLGNHRTTALSMMGLAVFPICLSLARGFPVFVVAQFIGGVFWSILAGAIFNYLADNVPEKNRASAVSWYIFVSNGSILIGSMLGPLVASALDYQTALLIFAGLRFLAGMAIYRWG